MMKKMILVVEDNKNFREFLKIRIDSWEHCEVITTQDGQEAISIIQKYSDIGLVITDFRMPKMNGIELIRFIKQGYPAIKTILLTADDMQLVMPVANAAGADRIFPKPFNLQDLKRAVMGFLI